MATIYVQPGSGTGAGTLADPYYWDDEFATAYAAAGSGGIIYLTDGTYQVGFGGGAGVAFNTTDFGDATIIALNRHKAVMAAYATTGYFKNARIKDVKIIQGPATSSQGFMSYSTDVSHFLEMTNCVVDFSVNGEGAGNGTYPGKSLTYLVQSSGIRLRGCTMRFKSVGACLTSTVATSCIIENCTIRIDGDDSNLSGTYDVMFKQFDLMFYNPSGFTVRNNIFSLGYTANASLAAYGFIRAGYGLGTFQNNCFHQDSSSASTMPMSSLDNATINTDNIDLDPQFLDVANGNFNLRATSPCLNAGYLG